MRADDDPDHEPLATIDPAELAVRDDALRNDGKPVTCTYLVYEITSDELRGLNPRTGWYKKLRQAFLKASELPAIVDDAERERIWNDALSLSRELQEEDPTYLQAERDSIHLAHLASLREQRRAGGVAQTAGPHRVQTLAAGEVAGRHTTCLARRQRSSRPVLATLTHLEMVS